jgi:hypothetical protein
MGLFGGRKKKKEAEKRRLEEQRLARIAEEKRLQDEKEKLAKEAEKRKVKASKKAKPVQKKPVAKKVEEKPKKVIKAAPKPKNGPCGKYEIYPEAGLIKYRLKASNGEILVVSFGYASRKGAKNGTETFIKAVETGNFEIITDKAGFSHFDLFGARGARVIAVGEFYKSKKLAESAVESVKKFYKCQKVLELDKIPNTEIREEIVEKQKVEENEKGKYQIYKEGPKAFFAKLVASNGQILLVTQKYASKQAALNGVESIKNAIANQNFTISRDKQNRYQYKLYTVNKQLIVSGETYPQKANCLSSVQSVLRFSSLAKVVEI